MRILWESGSRNLMFSFFDCLFFTLSLSVKSNMFKSMLNVLYRESTYFVLSLSLSYFTKCIVRCNE